MTDIISRLLDEAEKAQRKGHLVLAEVCRDASDRFGLLEYEIERLQAALLKHRASLLLADSACQSYWEWEYGDGETDPSLLVAWRKDYEARTLPRDDE